MAASSRPMWALAALCLLAADAWAQPAPEQPADGTVVLREFLILAPVTGGGRTAFSRNPVFAGWLLPAQPPVPEDGQGVALLPDGRGARWKTVRVDAKGALTAREARNGLAYCELTRPAAGVMILEGKRFAWARVGDAWYAGDSYGSGTHRTPVALAKGRNRIWLRAIRGGMQARLVPPKGALELNLHDATTPDLRRGHALDLPASLPVLNATDAALRGATLEVGDDTLIARRTVELPPLAPLAVLETPFPLQTVDGWSAPADARDVTVPLVLRWEGGEQRAALKLRVREDGQVFRVTHRSAVDGSIQYYGVRAPRAPPSGPAPDRLALILSLHGAGVQGAGQASSYGAKSWAVLVAPTNRRPFGFDWEDWGRIDALEALAHARERWPIDPRQVYLTGHSMGGHGTWHLGVNYPDRWAAIAPSAGWGSFWDYGSRSDDSEAAAPFNRAVAASRTDTLVRNLAPLGVFVVHGTGDRNVPPRLARKMLERLSGFHTDVRSHFEPGAGHWWGRKRSRGADCVDWPGIWQLFRRRVIDPRPAKIDFHSADLSVSASCHWVELREQTRPLELSRLQVEWLRAGPEFETTNLDRFRFDPTGFAAKGPLALEIDGQALEVTWSGEGPLEAIATAATPGSRKWTVGPPQAPGQRKHPGRCGPFKRAFDGNFALVYGTGGDPADAAATLARARYDAGVWQYRGNGRALLVADTDYDPAAHGGRNLILYGNQTTNAVLRQLAGAAGDRWALRVEAGKVALGSREWTGEGLVALAVLPHPTDAARLVGVVGATGRAGLRLSHATRFFISGVGYPDVTIFDAAVLERGVAGVKAAGYFGPTWGLEGSSWQR